MLVMISAADDGGVVPAPAVHGIVWNPQLQQLIGLQHPRLCFPFAAPADAMGLTALTGLSQLWLAPAGPGVDDGVVMALCTSLTGLKALFISGAGTCSASAVFAAVGNLTGLQRLHQACMDGQRVADADLALLEALVCLKSCCLPAVMEDQCSEQALAAAWKPVSTLSRALCRGGQGTGCGWGAGDDLCEL